MSTIKIKPEGDAVIELPRAEVEKMLEVYYPEWAVAAVVDAMTNTDDNEGFEFIDMLYAEFAFRVVDIDTAASESGMGDFNADTWCDDDEDDAIDAWIDDIEGNLNGFLISHGEGRNKEFFIY